MKNIIFLYSAIILFAACGREPQIKKLTYQNIIIISDLSSRLDNKPQKDIKEIHKIVQYFKNECVKPGEKIGDKSSISFSTFSEKIITSVDINEFKKIEDKQQFINSKGKYSKKGLNYCLNDFETKVKGAYNTRNNGLDLISVLIEKINNEPIVKKDTCLTNRIDTTYVKYDNHLYIFTDGYLEYLNKDVNSQFYFGDSEIKKVRQYCIDNNVDVNRALNLKESLCLPAYKNKLNRNIILHIMETHERDKNSKLQMYNHDMGQRDNEILEAVWRKWAKESGFKDLKWSKY